MAVDLIGFGIVFPILPLYARRFHASSATATGLVAAFAAASFVFSPVWGRLSDRFGRKPILLLSLVGTCAGSLITGLAGGIALLYVGRVVDGISGASVSVAQASTSDIASPAQRARLFGLLGAAFGLGFVAGPAIGALAALAGPRVPFFVAAALAGVNAVVGLVRLPETHPPGSRAAPGSWSRSPLAALAGGRGVGALLTVAFGALVAFSAFEATFALFGHRRVGLGVGSSAAVFAVVGLVIVGVQGGLVHPFVRRAGEEATLRWGLAIVAVGLLGLAFVHSWLALAPALLALTVGEGLAQTTMSSALAGRADPVRRGEALGAQQSAGGLARVIGPVLGGVLFERMGPGAPYVAGAAVVAVVWVVFQVAVSESRRSPVKD
ncbi:MAG TPA: MFS transporter [Acidimicrobiales bacterium]|nr:MFS transporter [Acidimicrobiales bacterium]